ncbi:hypothetical protein ACFV23_04555 [Streptomyces sp. NPDC059627]
MLTKFWETYANKLAERSLARPLAPAIVFWGGGVAAWLCHRPGSFAVALDDRAAAWSDLPSSQQIALLVAAFLLVEGSALAADWLVLPVLRLLEGYWPRPVALPLASLHRGRLRRAREAAQVEMERVHRGDGGARAVARLRRAEKTLRTLPAEPDLMMPTRLGNLLRSVESRPRERFGLDAVVCWPYLWMLLDDAARGELVQARAGLNAAARAWIWSVLFAFWSVFTWWALPTALIGAVTTYRLGALSAAQTYGEMVQVAFTLNRHTLYEALRLRGPASPADEPRRGREVTTYLARGLARDTEQFRERGSA